MKLSGHAIADGLGMASLTACFRFGLAVPAVLGRKSVTGRAIQSLGPFLPFDRTVFSLAVAVAIERHTGFRGRIIDRRITVYMSGGCVSCR